MPYQPPANSTFLSEQTSHQQPASSTFLSEQISTSHQPNEQTVYFCDVSDIDDSPRSPQARPFPTFQRTASRGRAHAALPYPSPPAPHGSKTCMASSHHPHTKPFAYPHTKPGRRCWPQPPPWRPLEPTSPASSSPPLPSRVPFSPSSAHGPHSRSSMTGK
jgi:hypothetical protein